MSSSCDKRVQVKIEVGHQSVCKNVVTPTGFTHDWNIFVRGAEGNDISHFVEKVVFLLHESFPKPKRVCKEPPYKVAESGYGSFTLPVEIHFRNNKEEPRKYRLDYDLFLQLLGKPPVNHIKVEALTFLNPSDDFEAKLLRGGACILPPVTSSLGSVTKSETQVSKSIASPSLDFVANSQSKSSMNATKTPKQNLQQSLSIKRQLHPDDETKLKKKKLEKSDVGMQNVKPPKDVPILSKPILLNANCSETSDVQKSKNFQQTHKKPKEVKKEVQSTNSNSTTSKPKEHKYRGKELKTKKEKTSEPLQSLKDDLPKLPKLLFTRTPDDVYIKKPSATTTGVSSNGGNTTIVNHSLNHEPAMQIECKSALLTDNNLDDHSSDDGIHADLSSDLTKIIKNEISVSATTQPHSSESSHTHISKPKKSKVHKSILNDTENITPKKEIAKMRVTDVGKTLPKSLPVSNDLYELYKALNNCQDDDKLQRIVDIVEESGHFDITSTTFDFNLLSLDHESITLLKQLILS
ncbi:protein AF-9 [Hydra vulgaris]|uniref:protein AF-9 n=1 Tax=Hydra vulgaris TaxID=6087 RepID=UPI001F5F3A5A|nr:protein AF-9 [Hydra vulgaris]